MGWEILQTSDQAAVYMASVLASISISLARRILMHYVSALARNIERADTLTELSISKSISSLREEQA